MTVESNYNDIIWALWASFWRLFDAHNDIFFTKIWSRFTLIQRKGLYASLYLDVINLISFERFGRSKDIKTASLLYNSRMSVRV